MPPTRPRRPPREEEVTCDACGKTVPRGQAARCASCRRMLCRLCARWYGHFMLVCDDCRAASW